MAERVAAVRTRPGAALDSGIGALADIGDFVSRTVGDSVASGFHASLSVDPFDNRPAYVEQSAQPAVASPPEAPTVPLSTADGNRLTAILVATDHRVAVIDDAAVNVGDVLRDGARVSSIQADRVWLVERTGRWRMLTLTNRGTR